MSSYVKVLNCPVCDWPNDDDVDEINADILNGIALPEIRQKHTKFSYHSLFNHKKHLIRAASLETSGLPDLTSRGDLVPEGARTKSFTAITKTLTDNNELLEVVVNSALEDLGKSDGYLDLANTPKAQAILLGVRDQIRKSVTEVTKTRQSLMNPALTANVGGISDAVLLEFMQIVKKAALAAIENKTLRTAFFNELNFKVRQSKELKWLAERDREAREAKEKTSQTEQEQQATSPNSTTP